MCAGAWADTDITNGGTIDLTDDLEISAVQTITKNTTIKSTSNKTITIKVVHGITVTGGTLTLESVDITDGSNNDIAGIKIEGATLNVNKGTRINVRGCFHKRNNNV